jgi:hypothetical protein
MFDVHYVDHEEEDVGASDVVVEAADADLIVDVAEEGVRNTPVDGRAKFVPLPDHRLTDRGRAIAGGNS